VGAVDVPHRNEKCPGTGDECRLRTSNCRAARDPWRKRSSMKHAAVVFSLVLLCAGPMIAQSGGYAIPQTNSNGTAGMETVSAQGPNQLTHTIAANRPADSDSCPVFMHAEHRADGSMVKTAHGANPKGIGQRLFLSLTSKDERQIVNATLIVHGLTPEPHVTRTLSAGRGPSEAVRTLAVLFSPGPQKTSVADIWVLGMSAVERIDLQSAVLSDGLTWRTSGDLSCRVKPDPFMLITNR